MNPFQRALNNFCDSFAPSNVAVIRDTDGNRIVAEFDTEADKNRWLEYLDKSTPSEVSYYDAITEAMNSQEPEES